MTTGPGEEHGGGYDVPVGPGLHSERTLLAWIRTAALLGAGGIGAAGVAARLSSGDGLAAVPFVLASLCGAVLLARSRLRYRRVERAGREGLPLDDRADAVLAWLGVLAVAAGSLVFVLTTV
ncbi:DUF202 domain-containing protein [Sphaerisporangium fuscum]|uniref:DUF202 domain-containing protein n=1 Tax=Sphaerisporangium fuscum TaxID=2835868 RepID=UPI001BDCADD2|nr:DUF202 domain-containing protein [Sphaerisporangium fuscum]